MRDTAHTALAPITWGSTYIIATELLPPDRPLLIAALRALPIGLLLLAYGRQLPSGIWWWRMLVLGTLNIGLFFALLFVAAVRLPGGVAATVGAIQPLLVVSLAHLLLGERATPGRFVAAGAGVVGVGLLVLGPTAQLDSIGIGAAIAATLMMATGTVLTKRWGRPVPLLTFTAWQLVIGGLLLLPLALLVEGLPPNLSLTNIGGFIYLGAINTGLAYVLWFRGLERLPAARVTFLALLSPVVALLAGFLLLGQHLSSTQLFGVLLVLGSVTIAQYSIQSSPAGKVISANMPAQTGR